jgi:superfamily II DNA or RNA helicase
MRTQAEKADYQRKHRKSVTSRGQCCYPIPKLENGDIDPGAVLWRQQHCHDEPCERCPSCTLFTAVSILYKLCSHIALLQAAAPPESFNTAAHREEAEKLLARVQQFVPPHLISKLPGGYYRTSGIMDDHFSLSGKMVVLDQLLRAIHEQHGRVLVFSTSTQSLDLIENHIGVMGLRYTRMDGQTTTKNRKTIADDFRANDGITVFLLSTRAMGIGTTIISVGFFVDSITKCVLSFCPRISALVQD